MISVFILLFVGFIVYRTFFDYVPFTVSADDQILTGNNHTYKLEGVAEQDSSTMDRFAFGKTQNDDEVFRLKGRSNEVVMIPNTEMPPWLLFKETK